MEVDKKKSDIKTQIEYYLSDKNLEADEFFHNLISKNKDGYLGIEYILQCNKVKKAGWTKEEIINSIQDSTLVESNPEKNMIRRKNNTPLPKLDERKLIGIKRAREKKKNKGNNNIKPIILSIKSEKENNISWKDIEAKFKSLNPTLTVLYTRFKKNEGHFGVYPTSSNLRENNNKIKFTKEFKVHHYYFDVKLCEGKELEKFNEENKSHLDLIVNKERNKKIEKKNKTALCEPVTLGGETYDDIAKIKDKYKKMFSRVKDEMIILDEKQAKFIKDLVKYHPEEHIIRRVCEAPFIGVGKIDPHKYDKAFFALDKYKKKLFDFLVYKCPEKIMINQRKKIRRYK